MKINYKIDLLKGVTSLIPIASKVIQSKELDVDSDWDRDLWDDEDEDIFNNKEFMKLVKKLYLTSKSVVRVEFNDGDIIDYLVKI